jgi:adenylosuccinate lyase
MATRMADSRMYAHLWTAPELDPWFEEGGRLTIWLDILCALAAAQGELGIIPANTADSIAALRVEDLDLDLVVDHTRRTSHSTLGLIHGLQAVLPEQIREYAYYGATVQDVSDTWFGIVMRDIADLLDQRLEQLSTDLSRLARTHRDTVMVGRTHGQPGAPITFGFKAASWADEVARHRTRLAEGRPRWAVGQLAGAVGVLGFFGDQGTALRAGFCATLGLGDPGISWTSSRDRVAEFGGVLAMICGTLARIGNEVYELQRPEIGELSEPVTAGGVGSITMPHKRNPEASEHLATLARLARASAGVLLEGMEHQHERDGRAWKAEWIALPELCELTVVSAGIAAHLVGGLEVHADRMAANLAAGGAALRSEQILAALAPTLGKHAAQALLQDLLSRASELDVVHLLVEHGVSATTAERVANDYETGSAGVMVDRLPSGRPGS